MRVNDAVIGIFAIIFGIIVFVHVQSFPLQDDGYPGPSLFPMVLSTLFIIVGSVLTLQGIRSRLPLWQRLPDLDARGIGNIFLTLAAIGFYILLSEYLGFLLTSCCIMFGLMIMLKAKPLMALPVAIGMTLLIYLIFNKALLVPLPRGVFSF